MAIAAVAALAGCGSTGTNGVAKKGAGSIVATAEDAVLNAGSVHIQGQFTSGAQPVVLDLRLAKDKGASGTVTIGTEVLELLRVGPDVYVKGDQAFYQSVLSRLGSGSAPAPSSAASAPSSGASASKSSPGQGQSSSDNSIAANAMQNNYLHIGPSDAQYQTFASLTDPRQLLAQIMQGIGALGKDGQKDMHGAKSIVLTGKNTRVYVAIDGQPYLERVLPPGGGTLDFTDYGTPVTLNPPPPGQVVDIAKLTK